MAITNLKLLTNFYQISVRHASIYKAFRKVMGGSAKKRAFVYQDAPTLPHDITKLDKGPSGGKQSLKRAAMLNKMFMKYVTDLMVNGEFWDRYSEFGIEISRIQVSPDFKNLNIFWVSKKSGKDDVIADVLSEHAFTLRHELSKLRVMGNVPPIVFVKDKHQFEMIELDKRMAIADFGEDYEPVSVTRLKHRLQLYSTLDEDIKKQIEKNEADCDDEIGCDVPEMPQNVLGLNHAEISNRLQKTNKKVESHQKMFFNELSSEHRDENNELNEMSSREALQLFLRKRQLARQKMKKDEKNYSPDLEYIKQELLERHSSDYYDNIDNNIDQFGEDSIDFEENLEEKR